MRRLILAGVVAAVGSVGFGAETFAFPASVAVDQPGSSLLTTVQYGARPGYWRRHYYRKAMRRYRGNPGAQYELKQNRQSYCRGAPELC